MKLLALLGLALVQVCLGDDLVQTLVKDPQYSTLVSLVTKAGLASTLSSGPFTLFAPTDDAFAKVPKAFLSDLQAHPTQLAEVLKYHVLSGILQSSDIKNDALLVSVNGSKIRVNKYPHTHTVTVQGAKVIKADIPADNGVIHVIDHVILPAHGDVVDVVVAHPELSTLVAAVQAAGVAGDLKSQSDLTLLAPSNAAFAKLDNNTLHYLLTHPTTLKQVLLYHVIPYTLYSPGLYNHEYVRSEDNYKEHIRFYVDHNAVTVNRVAHVTQTDMSVSNGVIHVIDNVLIPYSVSRILHNSHVVG